MGPNLKLSSWSCCIWRQKEGSLLSHVSHHLHAFLMPGVARVSLQTDKFITFFTVNY